MPNVTCGIITEIIGLLLIFAVNLRAQIVSIDASRETGLKAEFIWTMVLKAVKYYDCNFSLKRKAWGALPYVLARKCYIEFLFPSFL